MKGAGMFGEILIKLPMNMDWVTSLDVDHHLIVVALFSVAMTQLLKRCTVFDKF
jgi:hypothetical protein